MPLRTETIHFDDEIERLEEEREDLAEKAASVDPDNPAVSLLEQKAQEVDARLQGLRWARDAHNSEVASAWDINVDAITLAGLTGGEFGQVEDRIGSDAANGDHDPGAGATRVYLVAKGTVEAPYYDGEDDFNKQVGAVSKLPINFLKWAEAKVNELTNVGGNEQTSFAALVAEKRTENQNQS